MFLGIFSEEVISKEYLMIFTSRRGELLRFCIYRKIRITGQSFFANRCLHPAKEWKHEAKQVVRNAGLDTYWHYRQVDKKKGL